MANGDWRTLFNRATLHHLPRNASDHAPILLDTQGEHTAGPRPFRFESFWTRDKNRAKMIEDARRINSNGSPAFSLCQLLKSTRNAIKIWNHDSFGRIQSNIKSLYGKLDLVQKDHSTDDWRERENQIQFALNEKLKREEKLWKAKSRVTWLTTPDLNT